MTVRLPVRRSRGFSLIEALVVLALIGIITAMVTVPINSYYQRSHLETTARDLQTFLQSAYTQAVTVHAPVNLSIVKNSSTEPTYLWLDQAGLTASGALGSFTVPGYVTLAINPGSALPATWTCPTTGTLLTCDVNGRALVAGASIPQQSGTGQSLALTHVRMVDGSLTPVIRYDVRIFPLWRVTVTKTVL